MHSSTRVVVAEGIVVATGEERAAPLARLLVEAAAPRQATSSPPPNL